ncbi:MAG: hypothetical protein LBO66_04215 [Deltaproteobacteria bacterium]|nr:hypothetical protein [Deltaproteobacteria bacterium]
MKKTDDDWDVKKTDDDGDGEETDDNDDEDKEKTETDKFIGVTIDYSCRRGALKDLF